MSNTEDDASEPEAASREAVIVDYLPHGRPDDTRPQYQKAALAYALETESFDLLELTLTEDADVNIVDRIPIDEAANDAVIEDVADIEYDDLSNSGSQSLNMLSRRSSTPTNSGSSTSTTTPSRSVSGSTN